MIARTETVFVQHLVQENARMIASEGAPGAICTVQTRRQANDQEPCIRYAKGWHRAAVIIGVPAFDIVKES